LPTELRRLFTVYGPLWVAAPLALAYSRFARRGLVLVVCSLISMTFALDWGRMMLLSAPAFYPAGAQTLMRHPRWRTPALVIFALLILGYAIYMDRSGVQHGIIDSPPPPYPVR
jgi:predicted membrane-bound mannosyltransferase